MKLSIINDQLYEQLKPSFACIQKEGYSFVELHNVFGHSIEDCTKAELEMIKSLLAKYHLHVSNLASTVFFLCPLYKTDQVSLFNPKFYSIHGDLIQHLDALKKTCDIAHALNCRLIRIFPFRWPDNRKGPYGTEEDFSIIIQNIQKAVDIAKQHDVTLVLENCPYSHLPKGEMTLRVVKTIHDEHLKLLWDPANSYRAIRENVPDVYSHWNLIEELENIYPFIGHIHIKDYHFDAQKRKPFVHVPVNQGDIPYTKLLRILEKKKYAGILSLEPEVDIEGSIESMRWLKSMCV